jgi:hypothetical protein
MYKEFTPNWSMVRDEDPSLTTISATLYKFAVAVFVYKEMIYPATSSMANTF